MTEMELKTQAINIEDGCSSDSELYYSDEIERLFVNSHHICEKVIDKNKYILHIAATRENEPSVAVALSDNSCEIYNISNNQVANVTTLTKHNDKIVDCRFSGSDSNMLYTGSSDGSINLWDIRAPEKPAINFLDTTEENINKTKVFNCFDLSSNERLLTAGTDQVVGDAFLLFWDTRSKKLLGGYWESHTDDITQVKFHPSDRNKLMSGSVDGLINIYDLSKSCEDDALIETLNTESSVEQLLWFNEDGRDKISCITHTADLQLWNLDDAEPYRHIRRADIAKEMKKKSENYIYLSKVHDARHSLLVLAGSNFKDGECLRGLHIKNGNVQPAVGFKENQQRVRSSWFNENIKMLLTGGEKGTLNLWKLIDVEKNSVPMKYW